MVGILMAAPLDEGFEGTAFPPAGWRVINDGDSNTWFRNTDSPISGSADAKITFSSDAHDDWLITPKLVPSVDNFEIKFKAKNESDYYIEKFNVWLSTTGNDKADFTIPLASMSPHQLLQSSTYTT
jgi:hypothetical protein